MVIIFRVRHKIGRGIRGNQNSLRHLYGNRLREFHIYKFILAIELHLTRNDIYSSRDAKATCHRNEKYISTKCICSARFPHSHRLYRRTTFITFRIYHNICSYPADQCHRVCNKRIFLFF